MTKTRIFAVSVGLVEHKRQMGAAIWEYLWLLDRVNEDVPNGDGEFDGIVAHGHGIAAATIAADLRESKFTARSNLRKLEEHGYIRRTLVRGRAGDTYSYTITRSKKFLTKRRQTGGENTTTDKPLSHPVQTSVAPGTESCTANKEEIKDQGLNISSEPAGSSDPTIIDTAVRQVWTYYLGRIGRNPLTYAFTSKRRQKAVSRLRECLKLTNGDIAKSVELMKVAVDALAGSDWHMGRDSKTGGKRYYEFEAHLFGSYEQMERWWNQ